MDVHLDQINLVVRDMDTMSAFYERLGLRIIEGAPEWAPHHRSVGASTGQTPPPDDGGGIDLDLDSESFARGWNQGWPGGPGVVLGFRVPTRDDVDRLYADLTAEGHPGQQPPFDAFWGARYAVVTDPDGNAVGLMSPADATRRTAPPSPPS